MPIAFVLVLAMQAPVGPEVELLPIEGLVTGKIGVQKSTARVLTALRGTFGERIKASTFGLVEAPPTLPTRRIKIVASKTDGQRSLTATVTDLEENVRATVSVKLRSLRRVTTREAEALTKALLEVSAALDEDPPEPEPEPEPPGPPKERFNSDILDELAFEKRKAEEAARRALRPRDPSVTVFGGAEIGTRALSAYGPAAEKLLDVENNAFPALSLGLRFEPLHFFESGQYAAWSDLVVETRYRRSLIAASADGQSCPVDDDELNAAARYRVSLTSDPWSPRVGLGVAGGFTRTDFRCGLPTVSLSAPYVGAQLSLAQPILPHRLEVRAQLGHRALLVGGEDRADLFGFAGSAFLEWTLAPLFFARAGARFSTHGIERPGSLRVRDSRAAFALELGAYL